MNRITYAVALCLAMIGGSSAANACACVQRTEAEQLTRNNVIVQGRVVGIKQSTRLGHKTTVARVEVQSTNLSVNRTYINVEAYDMVGQCSVLFKLNEQIRFAALKRGRSYRTNICKIFQVQI